MGPSTSIFPSARPQPFLQWELHVEGRCEPQWTASCSSPSIITNTPTQPSLNSVPRSLWPPYSLWLPYSPIFFLQGIWHHHHILCVFNMLICSLCECLPNFSIPECQFCLLCAPYHVSTLDYASLRSPLNNDWLMITGVRHTESRCESICWLSITVSPRFFLYHQTWPQKGEEGCLRQPLPSMQGRCCRGPTGWE